MAHSHTSDLDTQPPSVVIDTNVVLDWLLFEEPSVAPMAVALEGGALRWIATQAMLDELSDVLGRSTFDRFAERRPAAVATTLRLCVVLPARAVPANKLLVCSDTDDQKFIDLAMTQPARWLLSRDKALLRLARKARPHGVEVLAPAAWFASFPGCSDSGKAPLPTRHCA
jgi:putative PIN family toxin of toxin-antitoxin system